MWQTLHRDGIWRRLAGAETAAKAAKWRRLAAAWAEGGRWWRYRHARVSKEGGGRAGVKAAAWRER